MQTTTFKPLAASDPLVKTLQVAKESYLAADLVLKAAYEAVNRENKADREAFKAETNGLNRDTVLNEICDRLDAVELKHKLWFKRDLLRRAEKSLIDCGAEIIKRQSPARFGEVAELFTLCFDPSKAYVKQKLIDLTLDLNPTLS